MNSAPNLQRYFYPDGVRESRMSGGRKTAARGDKEPGASFIHAPGPPAPWLKAIPCTAEPGRQPHASETASQPGDSLTVLGTAPCPQSLRPRAAKEAQVARGLWMDFRKKVHERERQSCQSINATHCPLRELSMDQQNGCQPGRLPCL